MFNLEQGERLVVACPAEGDHVATVGTNRKLLIFPLDQLPVMSRGKGVLLQRYREASLADAGVIASRTGCVAGGQGHADRDRARAMARPARPGRPHGAARLSAGATGSPVDRPDLPPAACPATGLAQPRRRARPGAVRQPTLASARESRALARRPEADAGGRTIDRRHRIGESDEARRPLAGGAAPPAQAALVARA